MWTPQGLPGGVISPQFIELANLESIKLFLSTVASTAEGRNLEHLWDRAFEEGQRALLQTLDKKLDNADDRGYARGFENQDFRNRSGRGTYQQVFRMDSCWSRQPLLFTYRRPCRIQRPNQNQRLHKYLYTN